MNVDGTLKRGRRRAESLMVDTCTIRANDGGTDFVNGEYVDTPGTLLYEGKCRVQMQTGVPQEQNVGGAQATVQRSEVHIPVSAPDIPTSAVVEITAVGEESDPTLVGNTYRVTGRTGKTYATARRLPVEEVST